MNKISAIIMALIVAMIIIPSAMATSPTINLCEKTVNTGNSWGVCDPADTTKAQGTFTYNNAGGPTLVFTASARGLDKPSGTSYSLIYYKDTDPAHVLPSTIAVNELATAISTGNTISFSSPDGGLNYGESIPSVDDINPKGKIWIVPSDEINGDGTLKWTGYANGAIMTDYLFESDNVVQTDGDGLTVQQRMGGIDYVYVPPESLVGKVGVCGVPTIGLELDSPTLDFDKLYPGGNGEDTVEITLTEIPEEGCDPTAIPVTLNVEQGDWSNTVGTITTTNNVPELPIEVTDIETQDITFIATIGSDVPAGSYTQTITITATY